MLTFKKEKNSYQDHKTNFFFHINCLVKRTGLRWPVIKTQELYKQGSAKPYPETKKSSQGEEQVQEGMVQ